VRAAAAQCERVTVIVMASSVESIPLALRVAWMQEIHADDENVTVVGTIDDVPIDLEDDAVCDTDAFATGVWHERYVGARDPEVEAIAEPPAPFHLYLLTDPDDVPFVDDGVRDGEHIRRWMTERFAARLDESGRRWRWLRGDRERRREAALTAISALRWHFADPLGGGAGSSV
jgi:nicotinamide riboside kinase